MATRRDAVNEPGRYMFRFGWLTVSADDLAIWRAISGSRFTLVNLPSEPDGAGGVFTSAPSELPTSPAPSQH